MSKTTPSTIFRLIIDGALIALGSYLFFGYSNITISKWYTPVLMVLIGLMLLPKANDPSANWAPGVLLVVIGLALIGRYYTDNQPGWLRYGLGGFLVASGAVDFIRQIRNSAPPPAAIELPPAKE